MTVFEGPEINGNKIGYIKQPMFGGFLSPTLDVMEREEDEEAYAQIKADAVCCIGGVCCDHSFQVTDKNGNVVGKIVKTKPSSFGQMAKELASDADVFALELNQNADLTAQQKANIFAGLYLVDYMFFENEGEVKLDAVNQECSIKCCDLYCCGCGIPCACHCGGSDDDDEDGGGFEDGEDGGGGFEGGGGGGVR